MTTKTQDLVAMFHMLPESEQNLAFELVKRLVLAWDSDYTKLTGRALKLRKRIWQTVKPSITKK